MAAYRIGLVYLIANNEYVGIRQALLYTEFNAVSTSGCEVSGHNPRT